MALDLGQQYQSTVVPAFDREGLVEGHVWVQSFDNVEKIQVTVSTIPHHPPSGHSEFTLLVSADWSNCFVLYRIWDS